MAKYKRQQTQEELEDEMRERGDVNEDGDLQETAPQETDEQIDWKKRHDDGRRFQIQLQQQNKQLQEQLNELSTQLKEKVSVPDNMEEFNDWVAQYPKVAEMVRIAARQEVSTIDETVTKKLKRIDQLDADAKMREEREKLARLQPDFFSKIRDSEEWRDWILNKAPEWAREAVFDEKNPDAEKVSMIVASFKQQSKDFSGQAQTKQTQKTTDRDAASSVKTKSNSAPKTTQTSEWSESRVNSLSDHEYAKYESEIDEAILNGTFVYDMRDAQ